MKCSSQFSAVRIAALFLFLALVVIATAYYLTFHRVVPSLEGRVSIPQLQAEVSVHWDSFQVPHVTAQQEADLFTVVGYLHARDRLWQMTRQQYKLEGLHTREIGEDMLDVDRFYLTMGFGEKSKAAFENLPETQRQLLRAYAEGVNTYIRQNRRHLAPEFALADVKPLTWEPWHSVGVLMLWSWEHHQSFWSKPALAGVNFVDDDVASALTALDISPRELSGTITHMGGQQAWESLVEDYHRLSRSAAPSRVGFAGTGFAVAHGGSDAFRLLFHSRESLLSLPDKGYEMVLQSDQGWRAGITIPGLPVMMSGQNEYLAWAILPLMTDDGDFYTGSLFHYEPESPVDLELDPDVLSRLDDNLSVKQHILSVKDGSERQILVKRARELPVVAVSQEHNRVLAFDWTGFRNPPEIRAFMEVSHSRTPAQLSRIVESIASPALQVLFVTLNGQTGRLSGGRLIADSHPLMIRGLDTFDGLPAEVAASTIVTDILDLQGNPVSSVDRITSPRISGGKCLYSPPWDRATRFQQLTNKTAHDQLLTELQHHWHNDTYSGFAAELTPRIAGILEAAYPISNPNALFDVIVPYLKNWNYEFGPNETAATLLQLFLEHAARNLYSPWLSHGQREIVFRTPNITYSAVSRLIMQPDLWPESHPFSFEEWIITSMNEAAIKLSSNYGPEPYDWQWSRVVRSGFSPMLFEASLKGSRSAHMAESNLFASPQLTVSGSPHSINAIHPLHNETITAYGATTMKRIMLVNPDPSSHTILSTGQSGNLFSDHFRDQFELWNKGLLKESVALPSSRNIISTQRFAP